MNLWIRSQDKTILINVKNLLIDDSDNSIYTVETLDIGTHTATLGKYKSKERALEVLNEIQSKLINNQYGKKINGLGEEIDLIPNFIYVYQMPKK